MAAPTGMRRLPLGWIEAFVAVARSGSLTLAAERLHLSLPALSRRIQLLEADLGTDLFRRLPRGVRLTAAGEAYFAAIDPAWTVITDATARVRTERTLRITVMPSFAANWLMPRLSRVDGRFGGVPLSLHTSATLEDLQARSDLDGAIRLGVGPWPNLVGEVVLPVMAVPVGRPDLIEGVRHARDLLDRPLIGTTHQPDFWKAWFAGNGLDAAPAFRAFDNLQVTYEAAAAGMGIALGLDPVVRPYLDGARLVPVPGGPVRLPQAFHLLRREDGRAPSRAFAAFREWLCREAAGFAVGLHPAEGARPETEWSQGPARR